MEHKQADSEYALLDEISPRKPNNLIHEKSGNVGKLEDFFLGQTSSKDVLIDNHWEYVIVFKNPDHNPKNITISQEEAELIYSKSFINLPLDYHQAFQNAFSNLNSINGEKIYAGGNYHKSIDQLNDSNYPCKDFLTLLRNILQYALENILGIFTQLILSSDTKLVYLLLSSNTESILEEAEVTKYNTQMNVSIVDPISMEPCDENLRPLRFLNCENSKVKELLKDLPNYEHLTDSVSSTKRFEGSGINTKTWDMYCEYLELVKIGLENKEDYCKTCTKSKNTVNLRYKGKYKLENLWDRLKFNKPIGPFSDYSTAYPNNIWKQRKINQKNARSILRDTDKIKLLPSYLARNLKLHYLKSKKIIEGYYPLHNYYKLEGRVPESEFSIFQDYCNGQKYQEKDLISKWNNNFFNTSLPLNSIRKYYGEKIALYFAFVSFYSRFLAVPSVVGIGVFIIQRLYSIYFPVVMILNAFYSVYMTGIAIALLEKWTRIENCLAIEWGQTDFEEDEVPRPQFIGTLRRSPVNDDLEEIHYPISKTRRYFILGLFVTILMLLLVLSCVAGILLLKAQIINHVTLWGIDFSGYICAILNAIQIQIFNLIFEKIVMSLNKMENQRTQSEYDNSLIIKTYIFQFFNSFNSLYYIAFIKSSWEGCLVTEGNTKRYVVGANCMNELYIQLVCLFIIIFLKNILELGLPVIKFKLAKNKIIKEKLITQSDILNKLKIDLDNQRCLPDYEASGSDGTLEDFLELAIIFGYITLFAVAFPLSSFLTYFAVLIETQVDRYKLLHLFRRPQPLGGKNIGVWWYIFTLNCTAAIFTNVGIICFTIPALEYWTLAYENIYLTYTISVLILIVFQRIVQISIPDVPQNYKTLLNRHKYIIEKKLTPENKNQAKESYEKIPNFNIITEISEDPTIID